MLDHLSSQLLAIAGVIFLALVYFYLHLMLDRTSGVGLRVFFTLGLFGMLALVGLINLRATSRILYESRRELCEERLKKLYGHFRPARELSRGKNPDRIEELKAVPAFSWSHLVCPATGKPYAYRPQAWKEGPAAVLLHDPEPHYSEGPWLRVRGRHVLTAGGSPLWVTEKTVRADYPHLLRAP